MGVPLICSAILVKQKGILNEVSASGDTDYLFHEDENSAYDLGHHSFQCGRKVDALKLWLAWKYYGRSGYEARVDRLFEMAQYATDVIRNCETLELMVEPSFLNICFRYRPGDRTLSDAVLDQMNLDIRNKLIYTGQALVNHAKYQGKVAIRFVLANPEVTLADLDEFFKAFLDVGDHVLASYL
jgi:glutamate/tyrosine decarboxylase-like PLP-dependent enzyme